MSDVSDLAKALETSYFGSIKRTHSTQGLVALRSAGGSSNSLGGSSDGGLSDGRSSASMPPGFQRLSRQGSFTRQGSFQDLPLVAVAGLTTRVSIGNMTSASSQDLERLFDSSETQRFNIEAVTVEGGWTVPLIWSTLGALLSALCFGYNNGNMNTQAAVMRDALGIPPKLHDGCPLPPGTESSALPANDVIWGFCVSGFCLSALLGSMVASTVADRHGRRGFLLANSLLYLLAGAVEAASGLVHCSASDDATKTQQYCAPVPCLSGLALLLVGRLLTGVACGGSTVAVPMYLGESARPAAAARALRRTRALRSLAYARALQPMTCRTRPCTIRQPLASQWPLPVALCAFALWCASSLRLLSSPPLFTSSLHLLSSPPRFASSLSPPLFRLLSSQQWLPHTCAARSDRPSCSRRSPGCSSARSQACRRS